MSISREVQSIIDYLESHEVPFRVTDINGPGHAPTSYHYAKGTGGIGLAVDFGGVIPGVTAASEAQMRAVYEQLRAQASQLSELIYAGPGITQAVKNGRLVNGSVHYGAPTWAAHRNHVHVAVPRGVFLSPAPPKVSRPPVTLEVRPMWSPPLQVVDFLPYWHGSGGYMLFADGGVGGIGDAPHRAGKQPLGNDYWHGRKPARIERLGMNGYVVIATSGERYEYP